MKKIILIIISLVIMNGCCLDQQAREEDYIESHSWNVSVSDNYVSTEYIYIAVDPNGNVYENVTIDDNGNVFDCDGNWLFSY